MLRDEMLKLIQAGILAPSADNMQPWKFRIDGDCLELSLDRNLMGLFFDPADVASKMGCGAVLENIDQQARSMGLSIDIDPYSVTDQSTPIRMTFTAHDQQRSDHYATEVFSRCTDRGLYRKSLQVNEADRKKLDDAVRSLSDYSLTFYDLDNQRKAFTKIVYKADTIRFSHEAIHNDFYDVLRFGDHAEKSKDGLAQETLGIESVFIPILRYLRPWRLTHLLNRMVGLHHMMALRGVWLPMVTSPSLVSIVHTGPADYLDFGRAMERFWLQATSCGLSVQPLGAFPLFLARLSTVDGEGFSDTQISQLERLEEAFADITPSYQGTDRQLVMLFRIGYSKCAPNRSMRRTVETFLSE
ncbi:hypothetical protein [Sedimenticola selenatireducens]|uniref:Nitroreductase domain-containing protein n=1 Tax=Sedimenticola selenatireducens TaxID=191960 RepID=A0A558DR87_9GAMM|nr:hypothetical protein [Sedimenticola selenatireducens]TVO73596.1 hypothetical protein FHP88_12065 [Sedimenticola selenatireducens]TVT63536.1 MAG: hypothetical protein FHK78_11995 [Sedimenticola selenatireducens]